MIYSLASLLAFSACSQEADTLPSPQRGEEIVLNGSIGGDLTAEATTRLPIESTHATVLDVAVARIDQAAATTWTAWKDGTTLQAQRAATNGTAAITFKKGYEQYYPTSTANNGVKFVAWYPNNVMNAEGKVIFTVDGKTDIMVTNIVEGSATDKFTSTSNILTFFHCLTRLTVKAYGDAAAYAAWGNITEVKILDVYDQIDLPVGYGESWGSTKADLSLRDSSTDDPITGKNLAWSSATTKGNALTLGYTLTGKGNVADTYTLQVTTAKGGVRTVNVKPSSGNFSIGYHYTVYLQFLATGIVPSATISDWATGEDVPAGTFPN